jgi:hypothetical protein
MDQSPSLKTPAGGVEPPNIRFAGEGINRSATPAYFHIRGLADSGIKIIVMGADSPRILKRVHTDLHEAI